VDITESKRGEAALRESEANFYSLVDQMPAGIFRKDQAGRYVFVNSWFCRNKGVCASSIFLKWQRRLIIFPLAGYLGW
jgi:hypothetical protein